MTPTREQIDAACERIDLASMWQAFDKAKTAAFNENSRYTERAKDLAGLDAVRDLMAERIAALTAELEASRKQIELEENAHHETLDLLDAERRAHAETRLALEVKARGRLDDIRQHVQERAAWHTATGRASPEAYRASRLDPGADVIDRLTDQIWSQCERDARGAAAELGCDDNDVIAGISRNGLPDVIRAVIASLAEMGVDLLPSEQEICQSVLHDSTFPEGKTPLEGEYYGARWALHICRARLAPVLGARRALELPSQEELAALLARDRVGLAPVAMAGLVLDLIRSRSAPPTDEQLAEEAERAWESKDSRLVTLREYLYEAYAAGARREGRR